MPEKRVADHSIVLAIQDTSYFTWRMAKTKGLGIISRTPGLMLESKGPCFAVTTEGLPVGILDQQIFARQPDSMFEQRKRGLIMLMSLKKKRVLGGLSP